MHLDKVNARLFPSLPDVGTGLAFITELDRAAATPLQHVASYKSRGLTSALDPPRSDRTSGRTSGLPTSANRCHAVRDERRLFGSSDAGVHMHVEQARNGVLSASIHDDRATGNVSTPFDANPANATLLDVREVSWRNPLAA